jgi:hypothetical protein
MNLDIRTMTLMQHKASNTTLDRVKESEQRMLAFSESVHDFQQFSTLMTLATSIPLSTASGDQGQQR